MPPSPLAASQVIVRASPLGVDRDMARYWWFQSDGGSLYVERPPQPGPEVDMGAAAAAAGAGPSGSGDGPQPMETDSPGRAASAGVTPAGVTPASATPAGTTPAGTTPGATPVAGGGRGESPDDGEEFQWGLALQLAQREQNSVSSEWGRYTTPEDLEKLMVRFARASRPLQLFAEGDGRRGLA